MSTTLQPPDRIGVSDPHGQVLRRLDRVGSFADALGYTFGRSVRIRTTRPSPDIWFDVGV
jgi:hypothetical protein